MGPAVGSGTSKNTGKASLTLKNPQVAREMGTEQCQTGVFYYMLEPTCRGEESGGLLRLGGGEDEGTCWPAAWV